MAFVPFTDGARVCIEFAIGQIDVSVCLHFRGQAGVGAPEYQALADQVNTSWQNFMLPQQVNVLELVQVTVYDLNTSSSPVYQSTNSPPPTGTLPGLSVPLNVAMVLSHSTGNRGRSYRGRTYLPGLSEADLGTRDWVGSALTDTLAAWTNFILEVELNTAFDFVIASRVQGGVELTQGIMTPVTNTVAKSEAGTRRKRLPGDF